MNNDHSKLLTTDQLDKMRDRAVYLAVNWAKSGIGYFSMRESVNGYLAACGCDDAVDHNHEAIVLGRRAAALEINVRSIALLDKAQEHQLHDELIKIAESDAPTYDHGLHR